MAHDHDHHHHTHGHHHAPGGQDWSQLGAMLDLEAEVLGRWLDDAMAILLRVGPSTRRHIADVGCGPGSATTALAAAFPQASVVALDRSPELLEMVRRRAQRADLAARVSTQRGDLESLHGALRAMDLIWAGMVLHHLEDLPRVLRELHAALASGGLLAIAEFGPPNRVLPEDLGFGAPGFAQRHVQATATALEAHLPPGALTLDWPQRLRDAGFSLVEQHTLRVHLPAPLPPRARQWVHESLVRSVDRLGAVMTQEDRATLAVLTDPEDPRGVLLRDDVQVDAGRAFFIARKE